MHAPLCSPQSAPANARRLDSHRSRKGCVAALDATENAMNAQICRLFFAAISLLTLGFARAQQGSAAPLPEQSDAGGVLRQLSIASLGGSGQTSIQALATDSSGNIFVAGTTNAPDFPVKNAAQPVLADARSCAPATWELRGLTSEARQELHSYWYRTRWLLRFYSLTPSLGIFKSSDGGQTWRLVYAFQPNPQLGGFQFISALVIDPSNHLRLAALGANNSSGVLIRSVDNGESWTSGCPVPSCGGQLIADPSGSGALAMLTNYLYVSRDWGLTFNPTRPPASIAHSGRHGSFASRLDLRRRGVPEH